VAGARASGEGSHAVAQRTPEDYEGLDRMLPETDAALEARDLYRANEALKRANVQAAAMWGGVGVPALPGHTRALVDLLSRVQRDLGDRGRDDRGRDDPAALRPDLRALRERFALEARREAR